MKFHPLALLGLIQQDLVSQLSVDESVFLEHHHQYLQLTEEEALMIQPCC